MSLLKIVLFVAVVAYGVWFFSDQLPKVQDIAKTYINRGDIVTLEARFTPEMIVEANRKKLNLTPQHILQEPTLKFYPYLLMNVKYTLSDKKTKEGQLLWGMTDGEIVLNTKNWQTTHGFEDCIVANANRNDFRILQALASNKDQMTKEELLKTLPIEADVFDDWVKSAQEKALIIQRGNTYFLHFENPKLAVLPQTEMHQALVTKPYTNASCLSRKYSKSQIEKIAKAAFGNDFTIRQTTELFLPVYSIHISNPDGSILTTEWNALSGEQIHRLY